MSLDYLVSAAALILFDQELPSPPTTPNEEMREGKVIDNQEGWELEGERNAND